MPSAQAASWALAPLPGRPACVVDARLALGSLGLRAVTALGSAFEPWMPHALRELLRARPSERPPAALLLPRVRGARLRSLDAEAELRAVADELRLWDRLPLEADLAAVPLSHVGERADEVLAPPGTDRGLRDRWEQLLEGLDPLASGCRYDERAGTPWPSLAADALALVAALAPYAGFALTRLESDGLGRPSLCDYADAWGLRVEDAVENGGALRAALDERLAASGALPLVWAGLRLAAVHVVLPGMAVLGGRDATVERGSVALRWRSARVFWHEV